MANARPIGVLTTKGQFVANRALERFTIKSDDESDLSRGVIDEFELIYERHGLVAPLYNPLSLARHLELNTYHARSVFVKAHDAAGLGWELRPEGNNPSDAEKEAIEAQLEAFPGTLEDVLYEFMVDMEATGYAVLEVARDNWDVEGPYTYIGHLPSHTIRVHHTKRKFAQVRGPHTVWFKAQGLDVDVHKDTGHEFPLGSLEPERRATELIYRRFYTPRSDYYGLPDHIPALGAISGDVARRDYNIAFFDNYGVPAMLVFITGDYDPGEPPVDPETGEPDPTKPTPLEETIQKHFESLSKNPYSTLILSVPSRSGGNADVKVTVQPLAADVQDASFRLYREDNQNEVISAHGVPPYRLGIAEGGQLGAEFARESTEIYKHSVIKPRQRILENIMNLVVLWGSWEVEDWRFALAEIDTKDEAHEMAMAESLFEMGVLTPNDLIRVFGEKYGIDPVEGEPAMDAHYIHFHPVTGPGAAGGDPVENVLLSLRERLVTEAQDGMVVKRPERRRSRRNNAGEGRTNGATHYTSPDIRGL